MRRVAEIIHIVDEERQDFLNKAINPDLETQKILWLCGVRKQQYFALNDLIFMTFEYKGFKFTEDMNRMSSYLDNKGMLVKTRRKDVPVELRDTTNWWAPVKRIGAVLEHNPGVEDDSNDNLLAMLDGAMSDSTKQYNTAYDEDDWSESFHF